MASAARTAFTIKKCLSHLPAVPLHACCQGSHDSHSSMCLTPRVTNACQAFNRVKAPVLAPEVLCTAERANDPVEGYAQNAAPAKLEIPSPAYCDSSKISMRTRTHTHTQLLAHSAKCTSSNLFRLSG